MEQLRGRARRLSFLVITVVVATFSSGGLAYADGVCPKGMSDLDCQALVDNWVNWVPDTGSCGAGTDGGTTSDTNESQAQQIAQTFIIGFDASTPKATITDLATKYHIGGMYVLGTKDAAAAGFNKAFYDSLDQAAGTPLIESSDEEGVITRYAYPSGSFPSAASMAKQDDSAVQSIGKKAGAVMASNGLSADLAPVLDLRDVGVSGRSFSSDPDVVADKAGAFAAGLASSNVGFIFKHFPGFDNTTSGNTDIQKVEMKGSIDKVVAPYKTLLKKYPNSGVMLSNMYVDKFDANNPTSLSAAAVSYIRNTLNFDGMITTDDLSVSSVTNKAGSLANAVAQSLEAGVTMPLFTLQAGSTKTAEDNMDKIIAAVQGNSAAMSKVQSGKNAIASFKGLNAGQSTNGSTANCCSSSTTVLAGGDNATKTWNYFKGQGLDDMHVAAIMGNIQQESGFNPEIIQGGGTTKDPSTVTSGGWGIVQWTPGKKVLTKAADFGIKTPIYELATQLNIVWGEMNSTTPAGDSSFMKGFKAASSLASATSYFTTNYEAAGIVGPRLQNAQAALSKYAGSGGGQTDSSGGSGGCITSVDCTSANGVGKILCAAKNYNSVSYQESVIGGHQGAAKWHKDCPTIGPSCYLDCSGLVNIAVYDVFRVELNENTNGEIADVGKYWKVVSFKQLQPGDLIQPGEYNGGHVEIVDHLVGNKIYTFGAHSSKLPQPEQVGPSAYADAAGNVYLHYIGPGL